MLAKTAKVELTTSASVDLVGSNLESDDRSLCDCLRDIEFVLRILQRPAEVVTATLERKALSLGNPWDLYTIGCSQALCVRLVGKDQKPEELSPEEQAERQKYANLAVETLREAVAAGYRDLAHLQQDKDLDAIRDHLGYRDIIQELEATDSANAPPPPPVVGR